MATSFALGVRMSAPISRCRPPRDGRSTHGRHSAVLPRASQRAFRGRSPPPVPAPRSARSMPQVQQTTPSRWACAPKGLGMAPKHGRLEKTKQRHQPCACVLMAIKRPIPAVFDGHVQFDEWKHACGQPGGVQWGIGLRHQPRQLLDEFSHLHIAFGVIRTDAHGKQDEQFAELQSVPPADLSVDGERAALSVAHRAPSVDGERAVESQWHLLHPQHHVWQRARALVHLAKDLAHQLRVVLELRQMLHRRAAGHG
eukprot:scaffold69892_cov71-Phaeocystis_antarctica.AAC.4